MTLIIYFYIGIKVKLIYKLCIIRFADYTVCKSVLLLYLDIKINYKCYFLNMDQMRISGTEP